MVDELSQTLGIKKKEKHNYFLLYEYKKWYNLNREKGYGYGRETVFCIPFIYLKNL